MFVVLSNIYGISILSGKISQITNHVLLEIQEWRDRPLKTLYPIAHMDDVYAKVRCSQSKT